MHGGHGDSTVSYIFTFNGSLYDGKAQMPNYHLIEHKSDRIVIRFLPSNPAINHPAAWEWSGFADIFPGIFLLFLTTMGGVALGVVYRDRKLARNGKATQGVVIGCVQAKRYFRVEYEFCTEDGLRLKGKSDCADEYGAGARIWILYLPQKPKRNHVYPTSFYEVVG